MASVFKNASLVLKDGFLDVYTCPAGAVAIVLHCQAANVDESNHDLSMLWTDFSAANSNVYIANEIVVPANAAYEPIGGKLVLESGDKIRAKTDVDDQVEVSVSVLEIS
jgi:hypothetical protein